MFMLVYGFVGVDGIDEVYKSGFPQQGMLPDERRIPHQTRAILSVFTCPLDPSIGKPGGIRCSLKKSELGAAMGSKHKGICGHRM